MDRDTPETFEALPMALAHLHRALAVGAPFDGTVKRGDHDGPMPGDGPDGPIPGGPMPGGELPGPVSSRWEPDAFADVLGGAGFDVEALDVDDEWIRFRCRRARTLPDTVGPGLRVLVCGLNPSLYAADAGIGFARPGNRFWPAALAAGLVTKDRDPFHACVHDRVGMTDLVKRATAAASELTADEYRTGAGRVERLVRWLEPGAVVFVGLAGWRAAVDRRAVAGWQPGEFGGRPAYVMPSTSGLNARTPPSALVDHLRTVRDAVRSGSTPA